MSTNHILIVYGTGHGQTAKIARRMAEVLTASGRTVTMADAAQLPRDLQPSAFDGILIGASIRFNRHQRSVGRFVAAHRETLNGMPSAFFSVSGSAASPDGPARAAAQQCMVAFLRQTGWRPTIAEIVAGAMAYTKYSPILRWVIARIARKSGGPTETSRDYEFTDWAQVERLAHTLAAAVERRAETSAPALA